MFQEFPYTSNLFSGNYGRIIDSDFIDILKLYGIGSEAPLANQLWFLRDLCIATIASPVIWYFSQLSPIIMAIIGWGGYIFLPSMPLKGAIFLYIAAASYVASDKKIKDIDRLTNIQVFTIYFICWIVATATDSRILKNLFDCLSIFTWIYISGKLCVYKNINSIFEKLANWTFIIYVLHNIPLQFIKKIMIIILPITPLILGIEYVFLPIIIIIICVLTGKCIKRVFPQIYNFSTGSR